MPIKEIRKLVIPLSSLTSKPTSFGAPLQRGAIITRNHPGPLPGPWVIQLLQALTSHQA